MEATHQIIMKKTFSILILLLATMTSVALTACGGDDDEPANPDNPNVPTQTDVVKKTISFPGDFHVSVVIQDGSEQSVYLRCQEWTSRCNVIYFRKQSITYMHNLKIGNYGVVNSLQNITSLSKIGTWISAPWSGSDGLILNEKDGFVIEGTFGGRLYYIRLWVKKFTYNASNELIGIDLEWQQFTPSN